MCTVSSGPNGLSKGTWLHRLFTKLSNNCCLGLQVVLFTNDTTISKGMVKYASNLSRESIIDVEGTISLPQEPVAACTQSQVLHTAWLYQLSCLLAFPWPACMLCYTFHDCFACCRATLHGACFTVIVHGCNPSISFSSTCCLLLG